MLIGYRNTANQIIKPTAKRVILLREVHGHSTVVGQRLIIAVIPLYQLEDCF
jgi:hypothetical protein